MDMNAFIQIISTVGFPIAAYAAMFWYMVKQNELHREEMTTNTTALVELKSAIVELKDKIVKEEKKDVRD